MISASVSGICVLALSSKNFSLVVALFTNTAISPGSTSSSKTRRLSSLWAALSWLVMTGSTPHLISSPSGPSAMIVGPE